MGRGNNMLASEMIRTLASHITRYGDKEVKTFEHANKETSVTTTSSIIAFSDCTEYEDDGSGDQEKIDDCHDIIIY